MSILQSLEVPVGKLRWQCDPQALGFETTDEIACCEDIIGQERGLRAIRLGLEIKSPGYNIYVAGLTGTGKTTTVKHILEQMVTRGEIPDDICYVYDFADPDCPKVLCLPAGQGSALAKDMDEIVRQLRRDLPRIFDSETFKKRSKEVLSNYESRSVTLLRAFEEKVQKQGFALVQIQMGQITRPEIFPVIEKEAVPWNQLDEQVKAGKLTEGKIKKLQDKYRVLAEEMEQALQQNRQMEKELQQTLQELRLKFISPIVQRLLGDLQKKYPGDDVRGYLEAVQKNILENPDRFNEKEEQPATSAVPFAIVPPADTFIEFKINVVVDNSGLQQVPVVIETAPSYKNLFGTIERMVDRSGVWHTDFTKIKAGSLLKANGGYIVLNLVDALVETGVWTALKRTLKNRKLDIQAYDPYYFFSTSALKPEAVEIDVKVVVIGDMRLFQMLYYRDDEFKKIFKVRADFDTVMNRDEAALRNYSHFVKKICDEEQLLPLSNTGVAEVIEYGVRLAGRQNKLSTRFSDIADVIREADYWARTGGGSLITGEHVNQALTEKIYRARLAEDKVQEMIDNGTLLIEIAGKKTGQLNGLTVYDLGDYSFGRPAKITATVGVGRSGITNIEREADLSGKTHNKGVLIIGGYLKDRFAQDKQLSMSASLAFEQSYTGIDGDSASAAEIFAILSELTNLPLRQDLAVTGSINQKGMVQPIGGVNQKIEGFFEVCKAKGLTGEQGVIIPKQNIEDLMLKPELVAAASEEKFHIYAITVVEEGIEILTGVAAGVRDDKGAYSPDTVFALANARLRELNDKMKESKKDENRESKNSASEQAGQDTRIMRDAKK